MTSSADGSAGFDPVDGESAAGRAARSDAGAVGAALSAELGRRVVEVAALDHRLHADLARLVAFSHGGKMLRSRFLCWGFRSGTQSARPEGALPAAAYRAAAALELIQACALLHDDIIDRSDTRRGSPSTHLAVAKEHAGSGWAGDPGHYGVSVALLLGDLALAWADDLFVDAALALDGAASALPVWREMRTEVLAGQLLDLRVTAERTAEPDAAEQDATRVNLLKTAAYTVARPLELGGRLAGVGADTLAALRGYGTSIGLAFQLRDDQLGVFGDPAVTGKPAGGDLIEGKRTVLLARTRRALAAVPDQLAELDARIGTAMSAAQLARLTAAMADSGAPEEIDVLIGELTGAGIAAISACDESGAPVVAPEIARSLISLADRASQRRR